MLTCCDCSNRWERNSEAGKLNLQLEPPPTENEDEKQDEKKIEEEASDKSHTHKTLVDKILSTVDKTDTFNYVDRMCRQIFVYNRQIFVYTIYLCRQIFVYKTDPCRQKFVYTIYLRRQIFIYIDKFAGPRTKKFRRNFFETSSFLRRRLAEVCPKFAAGFAEVSAKQTPKFCRSLLGQTTTPKTTTATNKSHQP